MPQIINQLRREFEERVKDVSSSLHLDELEQFFFSRKSGLLTNAMKDLKDLSGDVRKETGVALNAFKQECEALLAQKRAEFSQTEGGAQTAKEMIDVTAPKLPSLPQGHLHPMTQILRDIEVLFSSMGFMIVDGPELDSDYYNFESVNIPADHPARDMQDTLYIKEQGTLRHGSGQAPNKEQGQVKQTISNLLMRTQTSTMQTRTMQKYGAPLRMIAPGRVFRNEATDARHEHTFYQIEGLVVDKGISFAHMKGVLETVAKHLYGPETKLRLRPKFYPFVEPGVNGEVTCFLCKGKGCRVCKNSGWLEIFGAGMTHPNVLREAGVDPHAYSAFAFGFGLNRLAMLKYGIDDVRLFLGGDVRFLNQF